MDQLILTTLERNGTHWVRIRQILVFKSCVC